MATQLLRVREVQQRLALARSTVYEMIYRGELPAVKIGGALRVDEADLEAFLAERKAVSA